MTKTLEAPLLGSAPVLTEADFQALLVPGSATGPAPTMTPPAAGDAVSDGVAGAISGKLVTMLYAEQANRNAWLAIADVGWKQVSQTSDAGSLAIMMLGAHAKSIGRAPNLSDDAAGLIQSIYVW